MSTTAENHALPSHVPVLIVGAGPCGLLASVMLSRRGILNLVIEKRETVNSLPRARGLNNRSVEIMTQLGFGELIRQFSLPIDWSTRFVYTESMSGELIGTMPGSMAPGTSEEHSPVGYRVIAQDRLDPMLYDAVHAEPLSDVSFSTELLALEQSPESVRATLRRDGVESVVIADYVIGADGGASSVRDLLGIEMDEVRTYRSFVAAHFVGDLSAYSRGREGALIWSLAPGVEGVFHPLDGHTRWAAQIQYDPTQTDPATWTPEQVIARVRGMAGVPEGDVVDIQLVKFYPYTLTTAIAESFRAGRGLLVGDAAHRLLPYGGWGLNTGIQTVHNLIWKLAAVIDGVADDSLLDTFDAERREIALRNREFATTNAGYVERMMGSLAAMPTLEEKRAAVAASRQYGNWTGLDLGLYYGGAESAIVPDGVEAPSPADPVIDYVPHAKPGYRAPHVWVRDERTGLRVSLVDVVGRPVYTLLTAGTADSGAAWRQAAADAAAESGVAIDVFAVGPDGDLVPEGPMPFTALYGVGPDGAVLVRPDGHVAFRGAAAGDESQRLRHAVRRTLNPGAVSAAAPATAELV